MPLVLKAKNDGKLYEIPDNEREEALATGKFTEHYRMKAKNDGKEYLIPAEEMGDALKTNKFELSEVYNQRQAIQKKNMGVGDSLSRGIEQGVLFDSRDELAGAVKSPLGAAKEVANKFGANFNDSDTQNYLNERDDSRNLDKIAAEVNPTAFTTGNVMGGIATSFAPGLNVAKGASLANVAGKSAIQGGLYGLGDSEGNNVGELALDTAKGAGIGAGAGAAGKLTGDYAVRAAKWAKSNFNPAVAKVLGFTSGVDEEAVLRQITNPKAQKLAEAEGFAYKVGSQAKDSIDDLGANLGRGVGEARDGIVEKAGQQMMSGTDDIIADTVSFLDKNKPSRSGFSGITDRDRETLTALTEDLKYGNAEDLVKFRELVDSKLSHLYGKEGAANLYERQLMKMRGQADKILDGFSPSLNKANTDYAKYLENKKLLGLNNEATVETITDNLYGGANKTAKKAAAEAIVPSNMIDDMKSIAANKQFAAANKPGGDGYFRHGALPVMTNGASELLTRPGLVKALSRGLGHAENLITNVLNRNPEVLGKFAGVLSEAAKRGGRSLAMTHYLLSKNPEYQQVIEGLE